MVLGGKIGVIIGVYAGDIQGSTVPLPKAPQDLEGF